MVQFLSEINNHGVIAGDNAKQKMIVCTRISISGSKEYWHDSTLD